MSIHTDNVSGDLRVTVTDLVADQGTIVLLGGTDEHGHRVVFSADHRPADAILAAVISDDEPVIAAVPSWAIVHHDLA